MTVGELITKLEEYDKNANVLMKEGDYVSNVYGVTEDTVAFFNGRDDDVRVIICSGNQVGAICGEDY